MAQTESPLLGGSQLDGTTKQPSEITLLLFRWQSGDEAALDQLVSMLYPQLRALAKQLMRQERADHTLSATAVVHEAYLKLFSAKAEWQGSAHFYAVAARTMRRVLVDYARGVGRVKRGSSMGKISLETAGQTAVESSPLDYVQLLSLDSALTRLSLQDKRKADLIEIVYFGGLNCDEAALVMKLSVATVNRDLKLARAWLKHELRGPGAVTQYAG
jgi:RNA polymerase sigma-70 factor (ECF subfamily)